MYVTIKGYKPKGEKMTKNNTKKFNLNNKFDIEKFNNLFDRVKHTDFVSVSSKYEISYTRNYNFEKKEEKDFYCIPTQVRLKIVNNKLYVYELCHEDESYSCYLRSYYLDDTNTIEVEESKKLHRVLDSYKHETSLDFKINGYIASIHKREDGMIHYVNED